MKQKIISSLQSIKLLLKKYEKILVVFLYIGEFEWLVSRISLHLIIFFEGIILFLISEIYFPGLEITLSKKFNERHGEWSGFGLFFQTTCDNIIELPVFNQGTTDQRKVFASFSFQKMFQEIFMRERRYFCWKHQAGVN